MMCRSSTTDLTLPVKVECRAVVAAVPDAAVDGGTAGEQLGATRGEANGQDEGGGRPWEDGGGLGVAVPFAPVREAMMRCRAGGGGRPDLGRMAWHAGGQGSNPLAPPGTTHLQGLPHSGSKLRPGWLFGADDFYIPVAVPENVEAHEDDPSTGRRSCRCC
jgi:hypothetical protein